MQSDADFDRTLERFGLTLERPLGRFLPLARCSGFGLNVNYLLM
jgi:hypothetical protein